MRFGGMGYLNIFSEINIEKREQCRADTKWARTKTFCFPVYSGLVSSTCPAVRSSTDISRLSFVKPLYFSLSFIVPSCFYSKTNMYALRKFPLKKISLTKWSDASHSWAKILAIVEKRHEKSSGFDSIRTHASCIHYFGGYSLDFQTAAHF